MSPLLVLHEHLDGGLRPGTILELGTSAGVDLPADDSHGLEQWFHQGESASLERYLAAFDVTIATMQTAGGLERVAREALEDLAGDGLAYAEIRFAPLLHTEGGLAPEEVLEAVIAGLSAAEQSTGCRWNIIVDALRTNTDAEQAATLAVAYRQHGVVAFDLAGKEQGHPASMFASALRIARDGGLRLTLHAGESSGVGSIRDALDQGAERIGHGVDVIEECRIVDGVAIAEGPTAEEVHGRGVPLEICPTSNLHTKGWRPDQHPVGALVRGGFTVTVNTDNRLMSGITLSDEFEFCRTHAAMTDEDLVTVTGNAIEAAFCDDATRLDLRRRLALSSGAR